MAFNPFIGRDLKWLESQIQSAQDDLAAGKNVESVGSGDVRKQEKIEKSIEARLALLLAAASLLDSVKYPPDQAFRITNGRVVFSPQQSISDPYQA
jgi:hypothetical protein